MTKPEKPRANLRVVSSKGKASPVSVKPRVPAKLAAGGPDVPLTELIAADGSRAQLLTINLDVEPGLLDKLLPTLYHSPDLRDWQPLSSQERHELLLLLRAARVRVMCEQMFEQYYLGDISDAQPTPRRIAKQNRLGGGGKGTIHDSEGVTVVHEVNFLSYGLRGIHEYTKRVQLLVVVERNLLGAAALLASAMFHIGTLQGEERAAQGRVGLFRAVAEEFLEQKVQEDRRALKQKISEKNRANAKKREGKTDALRDKIVECFRQFQRAGGSVDDALDAMRNGAADGLFAEFIGEDVRIKDVETNEAKVAALLEPLKPGARRRRRGPTLRSWWEDAGKAPPKKRPRS